MLSKVFSHSGDLSGQKVNWNKSELFLGGNIPSIRASQLRASIGMCSGSLPFNYLGVPIFFGTPKSRWLKPVADRILSKFDAWKGSTLSMAGCLALIN